MADTMTSIAQVLHDGASRWPNATAIDIGGERLSFAELLIESRRRANAFARLGIGRSDRVCTLLDNNVDALLVLFGISLLGAVGVPLNTALRGDFLKHQLTDSGAGIVVAENHYVDRLLAISDGLPAALLVVHRGEPSAPAPGLTLVPLSSFEDAPADSPPVVVAPRDIALLLYTSGTTGPSKGCMISHNYICNMGRASALHTGVGEGDIYWTPCPLFHMGALGGVTLGALQVGATVSIAERFSLSNFWAEIERSRATVVMLLSGMLNLVADAPESDEQQRCRGQLHTVMGLPFPQALQDKWKQRFGVRWAGAVGYGLTEAVSITIRSLREPAPAGASGRRFADYDVRAVDDDGVECEPGIPGEIVVRPMKPDIMFQGYWNRPDATVAAFKDLWFHTGDVGKFDEDGFFYFVDRKKDCLRRGGENISSFELEAVFRMHDAVEDVAVFGVPAESAEEEVKVAVLIRDGSELSPEALCRWSVERLPYFAVPRFIEFREAFPRNAVGRVLKYELRTEANSAGTWDRLQSKMSVPRR